MEHFITTIVWIVMLSDYLQANPINMKVFSDEHTKSVQCPEDSTFYAPENVQEHCIASALECFRQELNGTVRAECDVPKGRIAQWLKVLDHLEKKRASPDGQALQEAPECACEAWPLVTFSRFREQIEKLAEQITAGQNTAE
ncbi:uncharacterized protein LOC115402978 isoform X2 [Salarias fasciatus]|uniref:uncharacterized protein LOC115402978 isoform X2 n=1 Tax=Salarias fasciatus TaxID=181472 RepID=UPI0011768D88|nr:uncharacterized protein LOC115402978 isoform X2 [Salarias fasciatus]